MELNLKLIKTDLRFVDAGPPQARQKLLAIQHTCRENSGNAQQGPWIVLDQQDAANLIALLQEALAMAAGTPPSTGPAH
jgi:hypothetical protein